MNSQRGQDLSGVDRTCPWERLDSVSKTWGKLREKGGEQRTEEVLCKQEQWRRGVKSNEYRPKLKKNL